MTAVASTDPTTFTAFADFFDGTSARIERVEIELSPDRLTIHRPGARALVWMGDELRELPDQADRTTLVLTRAGAAAGEEMARLVIADKQIATRLRANAPHLHKRPPIERKGRVFGWALGAIASVALIIFVLVPTLANQLAAYLPPAGEKALGNATYERIRTALGEASLPVQACEGEAGLAALSAMETRLNAGPDLPYPVNVTVLDHDLVNAFAMPGGRVVLFRGLIDAAENPDEVAAVLAHELGHVVHRDPTRDALRLAGSVGVLGLILGDFAGGTVVLVLANQLINAQYSQSAEAGADDYAHDLLTRAGLPPAALGTFFERLRDEYGDEEGLAAHFSSHPQMTARIEAARAAQAEAEAAGITTVPVLDARQWRALRSICGPASARGGDSGAASEGALQTKKETGKTAHKK
ncbi:MAG TPA: M48 family metallopeptidase [Rhodobacterales bacterium]|nr:M48 family metallopeptidase [Rhodobacterales bacterium]